MKKNQQSLMLFLILIFLIFSCAVTYYYLTLQGQNSTSIPEQSVLTSLDTTPSPDTNGTTTYKGPGFSVQYPSNFIITEKPEFGWSKMEAPQAVDESTGIESVMVSYKDTTDADACSAPKSPGYPDAECRDINGTIWLDWKAETANAMGPITNIYTTIHAGKIYTVTFLSFTDLAKKDTILNSFSFTN